MFLYIHFPYCLYKCVYCDFNSYASKAHNIPFKEYNETLKKDFLHKLPFYPKQPLKTIFFGGGTPSLMEPSGVRDLLDFIRGHVGFESDIEITLEANPKTIALDKLKAFRDAGINRISLGVQNLNEKYLQSFGRIHSAQDALTAMDDIMEAGFKNWSVDLIFGFPGETLDEWTKTLEKILTYSMPHLSAYAFTVEEEAPYGKMVREGRAVKPNQDLQDDLFWLTRKKMQKAGFMAYEVSNFAKPGYQSRHNINYWRYGAFIGIGAGAYGQYFTGEEACFAKRLFTVKTPDLYQKAVGCGDAFYTEEKISKKTAMFEYLMMGLRLEDGVKADDFEEKFGVPLLDVYGKAVDEARRRGLITTDGFCLTREGIGLLNTVLLLFQGE
ncbi:radical SAM family heme chaperone HemW [bacterium]|nr:radical SAM family heme chaperone HemW [bacterium]